MRYPRNSGSGLYAVAKRQRELERNWTVFFRDQYTLRTIARHTDVKNFIQGETQMMASIEVSASPDNAQWQSPYIRSQKESIHY